MKHLSQQLFFLCAVLAAYGMAVADDVAHEHRPITVRSRPVIERLPLRVIDPVDVTVTSFGDTLVIDRVGKMLFAVDSTGNTSLLGKDFENLSRVVDSPVLGAHVLATTSGSSRIFRCLDSGTQAEVAYLNFEACGLAADSVGHLLTANRRTGEIFRIDSDGLQTQVARTSESVKDLTTDALGNAIVLLSSGKVVSIGTDGSSSTIGFVPVQATRIRVSPDKFVIAIMDHNDQRPMLVKATQYRDNVDHFATVPEGTTAFAFDVLGNLTLANPDLRAVTRVTSRFSVPCPHCGLPVPMIFSPDAPVGDTQRRSF